MNFLLIIVVLGLLTLFGFFSPYVPKIPIISTLSRALASYGFLIAFFWVTIRMIEGIQSTYVDLFFVLVCTIYLIDVFAPSKKIMCRINKITPFTYKGFTIVTLKTTAGTFRMSNFHPRFEDVLESIYYAQEHKLSVRFGISFLFSRVIDIDQQNLHVRMHTRRTMSFFGFIKAFLKRNWIIMVVTVSLLIIGIVGDLSTKRHDSVKEIFDILGFVLVPILGIFTISGLILLVRDWLVRHTIQRD